MPIRLKSYQQKELEQAQQLLNIAALTHQFRQEHVASLMRSHGFDTEKTYMQQPDGSYTEVEQPQ